jgi:hypothetical protein
LESGDFEVSRFHNPNISSNGKARLPAVKVQSVSKPLESEDFEVPRFHNLYISSNGKTRLPAVKVQSVSKPLESEDFEVPRFHNLYISSNGKARLPAVKVQSVRTASYRNLKTLRSQDSTIRTLHSKHLAQSARATVQ